VRILVTNDDGVHAPGLAVLAAALARAGHAVTVVAPLAEASGAGAGVGPLHVMGGGIHVEAVTPPGLDGITTLGADALPALIVITACLGAYGPPPDLIVAGINPGRNVGRAVLHSGTVGAALTSVHFGFRGLAVSIQAGPVAAFESAGEDKIHFETAAAIAVVLAEHLEHAPARTVVNCNVPNLAMSDVRGIRRARLATSGLIRAAAGGATRATDDPSVKLEMGFRDSADDDDSDEALSTRGWAVVTPLASVTEDLRTEVGEVVAASIAEVAARYEINVGDQA